MKMKLEFPYPYVVKTMDEYFGIRSYSSQKKKSTKQERYKNTEAKMSKKKNLSILIATFWDYPHTGGLSNYITALSEGLRQQGHHVEIVSPNRFSQSRVEDIREAVVPQLKNFLKARYESYNSTIVRNLKNMYTFEKMLLENIKFKKYDILHAQDLFTANILGRINEYYGKRLLFTPHGMFTFNRVRFGMFQKGSIEEAYHTVLERKAIEFANHLIILSDSFREPLMQLGAKQENMTTVLTGIDYPDKYSTKNTSVHKKLVITCVARLGPRKGHDVLLDALSQMGSKYTDNVKLLIVGDGEMRDKLEEKVDDLNLSMVEFLGQRDDVSDILSKSDIFVLPTLNDSLPISIIEAMHSGVCVISTPSGGIPELVNHSKTGILVDAGDAKKLARALKFVIENEQAREQLGKNARKFAKKHLTREIMVANIEKIYKNYFSKEELYES
ncbi:GalNAc-alpha-(1-_4)-GalNAc-alpha-(1-_3)-diNAcBac-PP-undecaprenol alpha-1,4-N-acetyl-D-galactosaminyltransferase [Bacillus rhizoplanae]|uniref:GalNAc-alpha-(1->4)-GalNAc-alpha-(1->3)-diNAcBac-PP-undecaprenol alpha-1,4-N-acetyl-D-galactosaminyltransferase n=1 Tax=Bacillus rhizoplanae TaxID=2880966 RepID=A0ABM8YBU5_9BACI|nr:glycosyltransferase family 4 protein [Bacillus rhizoplanae]CAG9613259.1 GalNAc-alpha-(1->4)-GalNAc-alpha-(1->3)-diNAcBac-PP-undecaprenol alpha-1,4-N-acetyl-D-galactosaminyltransferase [Bacillus rhizoplanae]